MATPHIYRYTRPRSPTEHTTHPHSHTVSYPQYQMAHTAVVWSRTEHNLIAQRVAFWLNRQIFSLSPLLVYDTPHHNIGYWCTRTNSILVVFEAQSHRSGLLCGSYPCVPLFKILRQSWENHRQLQKCFLFCFTNVFCGCATRNSPTRNCQFPVGISDCIRNSLKGWHLPLNRVMDSKHLLLPFFG